MTQEKYAIRFGLGALKAVGLGMMEVAVAERNSNGKFKDVYDFSERLDPKSVNKKSIEALAKSGSFDGIAKSRRQIFESFDVLSAYASEKKEEASSNQMSLFGALLSEENSRPQLKKVEEWTKAERLQKEFEAFGFFLNEHPLDDFLKDLKRRGAVFSDKLAQDELADNSLIKMAGVIASSKHRSSARGRFAYLTISDPRGIFEAMVFDEALITNHRDLLADGSAVVVECLIRKDEGGTRVLVRSVQGLTDFIKNVAPAEKEFEDIKKQKQRQFRQGGDGGGYGGGQSGGSGGGQGQGGQNKFGGDKKSDDATNLYKQRLEKLEAKKIFSQVQVFVKEREPVLTLKSLLSQHIAPISFAKKTKVIFVIEAGEKTFNIELPEGYLLDEADVARIRKVEKIIEVRAN